MMPQTSELRRLTAGEATLTYTVRRTGRRRTVGIFVEPDTRVTVLVPAAIDVERVDRIVHRRLPWIRRQQRAVEALPPPPLPRQWVSGETHRYLGRQYRLKLLAGMERSVRLAGRYFVVTLPNPADRAAVRRLVEDWYREHAKALLSERVRRVIASTTWLDVRTPAITIRVLRQRWGSTTRAGHILFNVDLVKLPLSCIDYIVAHELVHWRFPTIGRRFGECSRG